VLDPAQNHSFRDHYLDVELDLSQVVFIATGNVAETIPGPLLDRMEVIRFDGYTVDEKVAIARGYLWPRQRERNGLREDEVEISDELLETIVSDYTREAGVRQLERELGKLLRKTATKLTTGKANAPVEVDEATIRDARTSALLEERGADSCTGCCDRLTVTGTGGTSSSSRRRGRRRPALLTGSSGLRRSRADRASWCAHSDELEISDDELKRSRSTYTFPQARSRRTARVPASRCRPRLRRFSPAAPSSTPSE
jgi:ATP-dependent Lon protease